MVGRLTTRMLAFVGKFVDTTTFIHMSGSFSAHVTGNLILFASSVGHRLDRNDILRIIAIPVFVGAEMAVTIAFTKRTGSTAPMPVFFGLEGLLLTLVAALAALAPNAPLDALLTLLLVTSMAAQNAAHRLYPQLGAYTTIMTGNITQLVTSLALHARARRSDGDLPDAWGPALLILAFAAGCLCAAPIAAAFGFTAIGVPAATLLFVTWLARNDRTDQN